MGEISVVQFGGKVELRQFNLINLESLNDSVTGLPGDNGRYWKLKAGVEADSLACSECRVARAEGAVGKAQRINRHLLMGLSAGAMVQEPYRGSGYLAVEATMFANLAFGEVYSGRFQMGQRRSRAGGSEQRDSYRLELRRRLAANLDLRLGYSKDRAEEAVLSLGYYF